MRHRLTVVPLVMLVIACSGTVAEPDPNGLSADARGYLTAALDLMERNSINRFRIDWRQFRATTLARAANAQTPAETHAALQAAVRDLGDNHSAFLTPAAAVPSNPAPTASNIPMAVRLDARTGYLFIPRFSGTNPHGRVDSTQSMIRAVDTSGPQPPCGWIVDLRNNGGGNMYPMVAGAGPILGEGTAGQFVDPTGARSVWFYRGGGAGINTTVHAATSAPYQLQRPGPPVAVLHNAGTSSSGEATAISFRGRPDTRSFGSETSGHSTANSAFTLRDGARLVLTVSTMADRNGVVYGGRLPPDEPVAATAAFVPGARDDVVNAAMRWLALQPACAD